MTANRKYQKERANKMRRYVGKAVCEAWICLHHAPDHYLRYEIEHKQLELI